MIYHITTQSAWNTAQTQGVYSADSLANEGFIHCSSRQQIIPVANAFYRDVDDLILLCIEEDKLTSPLKWEAPAHPNPNTPIEDQDLFPHIYGTINPDAVIQVVPLLRKANGDYALSPNTP